jgi:hypothetical protein
MVIGGPCVVTVDVGPGTVNVLKIVEAGKVIVLNWVMMLVDTWVIVWKTVRVTGIEISRVTCSVGPGTVTVTGTEMVWGTVRVNKTVSVRVVVRETVLVTVLVDIEVVPGTAPNQLWFERLEDQSTYA